MADELAVCRQAMDMMRNLYSIKSKEFEDARKKLEEVNLIIQMADCDCEYDPCPCSKETCLPCRILKAITCEY
jgi:hypothetical protein